MEIVKGDYVTRKSYNNDTVLKDIYPQIFTIQAGGILRSFSYSEIINKEVVLSFV